MHLIVNGRSLVLEVSTLSELVEALGQSQTAVATAVNGEFVASTRRNAAYLRDDDHVEIVSSRPGG